MARKIFFFIEPDDLQREDDGRVVAFILRNDEHHHVFRVLRSKVGDELWGTDGKGAMFHAGITAMNSSEIHAAVIEAYPDFGEESFRLTLAQAVPKQQRFEWLLEKGTEIGIDSFWPLRTKFSEVHPGAGKRKRWERIVKTATKQCGRSRCPELLPDVSFEDIMQESHDFTHKWIAHGPEKLQGGIPAADVARDSGSSQTGIVLIGPEGGFSGPELEMAVANGFSQLMLGTRRLRSETAGLAAALLVLEKMRAHAGA